MPGEVAQALVTQLKTFSVAVQSPTVLVLCYDWRCSSAASCMHHRYVPAVLCYRLPTISSALFFPVGDFEVNVGAFLVALS